MTAGELIGFLQAFPDDTLVEVEVYEVESGETCYVGVERVFDAIRRGPLGVKPQHTVVIIPE